MTRRNHFESADPIYALNTGGMLDIVTATYQMGRYGEMIMNGGLSPMTGITGPGNTYKSALMWDMMLAAMNNYRGTEGVAYDTEISMKPARPLQLAHSYPRLMGMGDFIYDKDFNPGGLLAVTNGVKYSGDKWFDLFCTTMDTKAKEAKDELNKKTGQTLLTTPFINQLGENIRVVRPDVYSIDSISNFTPASVEKMQNEADIGTSDRNMEVMRGGMAKTQMLMEMPVKTGRGGGYIIMTAHMGRKFEMDPRSPSPKQLTFLKQNMQFKNTPEKYSFLMHNVWVSFSSSPYWVNSSDRAPMYPRDSDDKMKNDTDLMQITVANLRGKSGGSGMPFDMVVSQSEGVLHGLSELDYLKQYDRYGLEGNVQNYQLALYPEAKLSRTAVRTKLDNDERLKRAMHITYEMCFMRNCWHHLREEEVEITPVKLRQILADKGYDWNMLLDTTTCWNFLELFEEGDAMFLSTYDLIRMALGEYHPYWMSGDNKKPGNTILPRKEWRKVPVEA